MQISCLLQSQYFLTRARSAQSILLCFVLIASSSLLAQDEAPWIALHNAGQIQWPHNGILQGNQVLYVIDPVTGDRSYPGEYPRNSATIYGYHEFLVGGVRNGDTVTCDFLHFHGLDPGGQISSITTNSPYFDEAANAVRQISFLGTDVLESIIFDGTPRTPTGIRISETSYSWSSTRADDFVIWRYRLANTLAEAIDSVFFAVSLWGRVRHDGDQDNQLAQTVTGYHWHSGSRDPCGPPILDSVVYIRDNNGNPAPSGEYGPLSPKAAIGLVWLALPPQANRLNLNWWSAGSTDTTSIGFRNHWGPQRSISPTRPPRRLTNPGPPLFQLPREQYYTMAHPEFDYDQIFAAQDRRAEGWIQPPDKGDLIAEGGRPIVWYSAGPVTIRPFESVEFAFAIVAGDSVHTDPAAYQQLWSPFNPRAYEQTLDWSRLAQNVQMAKRVWDNPGVDTDSDGYRGEFAICEGDTLWYRGDGVPDIRADLPPPSPLLRITPEPGKLTIRWNGYYSETVVDAFTQLMDFEGYRLYLGLDDRPVSMSLKTSYDRENYLMFKQVRIGDTGSFDWKPTGNPIPIDTIYAIWDSTFDPNLFTPLTPLRTDSGIFYFEPQDYNASVIGGRNTIRKRWPDEPPPPLDTLLWTPDILTDEYGDRPLPKYYEYEFVMDSILPSVSYHVSVTAFDFGFVTGGVPAQESSQRENIQRAYALEPAWEVAANNLDVFVYPNPYIGDGSYVSSGFEERRKDLNPQLGRLIHFANLPNKCTITIYTLDGDRVITIDHDLPIEAPDASHATWNLVSRNRQLITSGTYYWVVESETRTQIGKFVVIK